jgi:UDP-2,4-diacetamido-2,4,6-trideoxy-beta-L-altropyranose hydrolase
MKIAFRLDASPEIGAGHAMRCLTLADELVRRGGSCFFVTNTGAANFVPALGAYPHCDPDQFLNTPPAHDALVIDHYGLGLDDELRFRAHAKVIAVIDDPMDKRHDADVMHNQSYGVRPAMYAGLVPVHCKVLTGPANALMKPVFAARREEVLARRFGIKCIERILLNFGGNDQKNMILTSLQAIKRTGYSGTIDVAFGLIAPHRNSVESFCKSMPNTIAFHINPDMAALMALADFAIGAPAVTQWERFAFGLPTLVIQTADNQAFAHGALTRDGLSAMPSLDHLGDPGWLTDFDASWYRALVRRYAAQTKGDGASLLAEALEQAWRDKNEQLR